MDLKETELTLGLPGKSTDQIERRKSIKRNMKTRNQAIDRISEDEHHVEEEAASSSSTESPSTKVQLVGWPPVKTSRTMSMMMKKNCCKFVKVAVDGAPYLRKIDIEMYNDYAQLFKALEDLFSPFTIRNVFNDSYKLRDGLVPTFEDKDGDWMMVGDVPWKLFTESCKRIRLMKSSDFS